MSNAKPARPLSPHLQIYRPQLTSIMSIVHRATGVWLALGLPVFVAWLVFVAAGKSGYDMFLKNYNFALGFLGLRIGIYIVSFYILLCLGGMMAGTEKLSKIGKFALGVLQLILAGVIVYGVCFLLAMSSADMFDKGQIWLGQAMVVAWSWAFFYHFCTGIRHLLWDAGYCLSLRSVYVTGWTAFAVSTLLTVSTWLKLWGYMS